MKVGLMHFRVFETDGVSLEMDKWCYALEKLGHEVVYISGSETKRARHIYVEELYYKANYNSKIHKNAFKQLKDFKNEEDLLGYIYEMADIIETKLEKVIRDNNIDLLIPNNMASLGFNLPVGIAIARLNKREVTKFIYHHHDFYFERSRYSTPLFSSVEDILIENFPYKGKAIHCTINELAKEQLLNRKGIIAKVIPNVFNFKHKLWGVDEYNRDLREKIGIKDNDIVFLQATRIVKRKGIELGYYIIEAFANNLKNHIGEQLYSGHIITKDTKVHFVLAGLNEYEGDFSSLDKLIRRGIIEVHYINDFVDHTRKTFDSRKIYSLWDVYTICDFITYPSVLEGWGNQLLEGLFAKKPLLVYEYPVYKSDISKYGLKLVTFDSDLIYNKDKTLLLLDDSICRTKSEELWNIMLNKEKYSDMVNENFEIGSESLSYISLSKLINQLLNEVV